MEKIKWLLDFQWAHGLSTTTATVFFMVFFALIMLFGIHFKREYVYQGAEDQKTWRDLRLWVVVVMLLQISLYLFDWSGGKHP